MTLDAGIMAMVSRKRRLESGVHPSLILYLASAEVGLIGLLSKVHGDILLKRRQITI